MRAAEPSLAALAVAANASPARAEEVIFRCWFDWSCDIHRKCQDAALDVRFRTNITTNSVVRLGGDAAVPGELLSGDRAITVFECPVSGGAATTTFMISNGDAVRSENLVTGRDLTPMQNLGQCQSM